MKTVAVVAITVGAVGVLAAVGATIIISTGAYNVAATSPHSKPVEWLLAATADRSVEVRAEDLKPPAAAVAAKGRAGFKDFENLCVMCHGAPGIEASEIGKGLYPAAPELSKATDDVSLAEVYWIVAHGIKDTGMPAFRLSRTDDELWMVASFVKRLAKMSEKDYQTLRESGDN